MKAATVNFSFDHLLKEENITGQLSDMVVTCAGRLVILSGGESASEGGMGSGSKSGAEKGEPGGDNKNSSAKTGDIETENTFDPVKEDIEKKESEMNSKE